MPIHHHRYHLHRLRLLLLITADFHPGVFGTRIPSTVSFIVGLLLFFLPFAQLKCGGTVWARNSGLGLAIGSQWKTMSMMAMVCLATKELMQRNQKMDKKQDPNLYAIVAMGLAAARIDAKSFANGKAAGFGGLVTGIVVCRQHL